MNEGGFGGHYNICKYVHLIKHISLSMFIYATEDKLTS